MDKYFFHDIKGKNGTITKKGISVADTLDAAKQSYHAYLGAYAYGHDKDTDFVSVWITDSYGGVVMTETWQEAPFVPDEE